MYASTSFAASSTSSMLESLPAVSNSTRFFFAPLATRSIMEEAKGPKEAPPLRKLEQGSGNRMVVGSVTAVAMASDDPLRDFRVSMEEMVEAHRVREFARLKELLHCYLWLNEKRDHKMILIAFVDLLINLTSNESTPLCL